MKNITLLIAILFSGLIYGQDSTNTKESNGLNYYVATGISMANNPNGDFLGTSFPSAEFGIMCHNLSLGLVGGTNNLSDSGTWFELKSAVFFPLGHVDGYGLVGLGTYSGSPSTFIEYGVGISCSKNVFGTFLQVSNWDGIWYVTPGVSVNF